MPEAVTLSAFQKRVAQVFFALPESRGFLLAGGAAQLAQGLTNRPTQDLDLFTASGTDVAAACTALENAARDAGWTVRRLREEPTFCRMLVEGDETLLVDLAQDSPPLLAPEDSGVGPTFAVDELAARKVVALFDRAAARDFVDVHQLARRWPPDRLYQLAAAVDPGLDRGILAEMLDMLDRYRDEDLPAPAEDIPGLRRFFADWAAGLRG